MKNHPFKECIDACLACATTCSYCITECLQEADVKMMVKCIELNRQCELVCRAAAAMMSIGGVHATHLCAECAELCTACAAECKKHAHMDHCKQCADACTACAEKCKDMIAIAA